MKFKLMYEKQFIKTSTFYSRFECEDLNGNKEQVLETINKIFDSAQEMFPGQEVVIDYNYNGDYDIRAYTYETEEERNSRLALEDEKRLKEVEKKEKLEYERLKKKYEK